MNLNRIKGLTGFTGLKNRRLPGLKDKRLEACTGIIEIKSECSNSPQEAFKKSWSSFNPENPGSDSYFSPWMTSRKYFLLLGIAYMSVYLGCGNCTVPQ